MGNIQKKLEDERKRQKDRDEQKFPEAWKPTKAGESLVGEVMGINAGFGKSEDLMFWTIKDESGKEWSVLETATLSTARTREGIVKGDSVGISFEGMGTTKAGRQFKKFVVVKE